MSGISTPSLTILQTSSKSKLLTSATKASWTTAKGLKELGIFLDILENPKRETSTPVL